MKIKDYEKNQRKIILRSDKPKKSVMDASVDMKKSYYDEGRVDVIERSLQWMLNEFFVAGYLTNEVKVSVDFREFGVRGEVFMMGLKVLE